MCSSVQYRTVLIKALSFTHTSSLYCLRKTKAARECGNFSDMTRITQTQNKHIRMVSWRYDMRAESTIWPAGVISEEMGTRTSGIRGKKIEAGVQRKGRKEKREKTTKMDREGEGEGEREGGRERERKTGRRRGAHLYPYPTQSTCDYRRSHALRDQRCTPRARQSPNPSHVRPQTPAMTVSGVCLSRGSISLAVVL